MIREQVRVVGRKANRVQVELLRQSACAGCAARAGCGQPLLARLSRAGNANRLWLELPSGVGARPGDQVVLGIQPSRLLAASFWLYAAPAVGVVMGGLMGQWLGASDLWALLGAVLAGGLALQLSRYRVKGVYSPVRVLKVNPESGMRAPLVPGVKVL